MIFVSGQGPVDLKTKKIVDGGIKEQTVCHVDVIIVNITLMISHYQARCIENLANELKAAGSSLEKLVKVNVYLTDFENFHAANEVYAKVG